MKNFKLLSVVVPVYSEDKIISEFYSRLRKTLNNFNDKINSEIIFINDGSIDGSLELLKSLNKIA